MKDPFSQRPRPSVWKRRGAFLGAAYAILALGWPFLRRAISDFSIPAQPMARLHPAREAKRQRSLSKALDKLDAKVVRAYFERWSGTEKSAAHGARRAVYIDAERLARRHPAWQLAQKLESGVVSPSSPQIVRVLNLLPGGSTRPAAAPLLFQGNSAPQPALAGVILRDSTRLKVPLAQQSAALNRFLAQSAARDAGRARDEALLSQRALEDETARAARGIVSDLELPTLPSDVALELLNLRIELLRNLSRTPVQRAAAREQIRIIEARYAEILRGQAQAQSDRLRAATVEAPQLARREGLLQIEREQQASIRSGARARREVVRETQALLKSDATLTALALALPPLQPVRIAMGHAANFPIGNSNPQAREVFETAAPMRASKPLQNAVFGSERHKLALKLRRKARLDSVQWARECAAFLGAGWSRNPKSPDATSRALEIVFPSPS